MIAQLIAMSLSCTLPAHSTAGAGPNSIVTAMGAFKQDGKDSPVLLRMVADGRVWTTDEDQQIDVIGDRASPDPVIKVRNAKGEEFYASVSQIDCD